jgi:type II secretory ATPase GspE/PulE/Tfp pilus assembly ATPase PilB-like protein
MMVDSKKISGEVAISRIELPEKIKNISSLAKLLPQVDSSNATLFLERVFIGAIDLNVSDIHFEPEEGETKIRFRIDGVLQDLATMTSQDYRPLLSRLKLLSGIKLNIANRPQDGRFSIADGKNSIEIRSSTLPTEYGETVVLRILNPQNLIEIQGLGLRKDLFELFRKEIARPNGMLIVTGPTGSGKTTTLYAFLKGVQNSEIKIITIEDPIEYRLEGISQTQVDSVHGYDFASGLKAIVRQDPDVILVGEIRDLETAEIALQAALTGHLVFSTLHTNDASGTIARLVDLGAQSPTIAAAINLTIGQRLLRKVCPRCAKLEPLSPETLRKMENSLKGLPETVEIPALSQKTKIPRAQGCEDCNFTGYRGRLGVFEAFVVDEEIEKLILSRPTSSDLKKKAMEKGMVTLYQDGLIRVLQGITTLREVDKIVGED